MAITNYKNLDEEDFDKTVWRYLSFSKYVSLLSYGALWFPKLKILIDEYEGTMPTISDKEMHEEHQRYKRFLHPSLHQQIDDANKKNVDDGRELTLANCWFLSEHESRRMWDEYAGGPEAVAITSTVRSLCRHVYCDPQFSCIGKIKYVDLDSYSMSHYEANQAHERALLKRLSFSHEQELRITTMSIRGPMSVNMDGSIPKPEEYEGPRMNNFDNPGLYIKVDLQRLITSTVLAPGATTWFELLVKRLAHLTGLTAPVKHSEIDKLEDAEKIGLSSPH